MNKKIFILMFMIVLLVGTVSASDWSGIDNYKVFKEDGRYGKIEIWDSATTILFQPDDRKLVEYTLTDNTGQCLINCHAEGTAILYEKGKLFDDLNFKDNKGKSVNLKEDKILIWNNYEIEVEVNDYKEVCEDVFNETNQGEVCTDEIVGTHKEMRPREEWIEYNFESLDAGTYKWRIEGKKDIRQSVDWIGTSFGTELTDWAWWDADWEKKQPVYINTTLLEKNHTSVLINVSYDAYMNSNFSDIRFVDSAETTEIGYWFYNNSYRDSNSVQIWLNTGNLSATENRTYYMYYENAGVETTSNIDNAFWFADDFNGSDVDFTSRWQSSSEADYTILAGGFMNGTGTASANKIETQDKFASEYVIESRFATSNAADGQGIYFMGSEAVAGAFSGAPQVTLKSNLFTVLLGAEATGGVSVTSTFYRARIEIKSNPCNANWSSDTLTNLHDDQDNCARDVGYVGFLAFNTPDITVDWVYVKRYMSAEPTINFGIAENMSVINIIQSYPVNYFNTTDTTTDLSCNFTGIGTANITDVTVLVYDSGDNLDYTNTEGSLNSKSYNKTWTTTVLTDDTYLWACYGKGFITESYVGNRTFTIDTTAPVISFDVAATTISGLQTIPYNVSINYTIADPLLQNCRYNSTWDSAITYLTCNQNLKIGRAHV